MSLLLAFGLFLQVGAPQDPGRTVEQIRERARSAEVEYEQRRRRLAPFTAPSPSGRCDEQVGRFCLRFDDDTEPDPIREEDPRVVEARREAIDALALAARAVPYDFRIHGGLVRLLIEDGRADDAVAAAHRFSPRSDEAAWKHFLLGVALQAAGWTSGAESEFERGLSALGPLARDSMLDLEPLLERDEWRIYRSLDAEGRRVYEAEFWEAADPLYILPGNERRTEHLGRYVWTRILALVPRSFQEPAWGSDLTELTLRYGVPVSKEKQVGRGTGTSLVERYDTAQRSLVPAALRTRGHTAPPAPGEESAMFRKRARSGFAPSSVRRLLDLPFQVSRFLAGDAVLVRVDARLTLDSIAAARVERNDSVLVGLVLRPLGGQSSETRVVRRLTVQEDSIDFAVEAAVPPGEYLLSAEAVEGGSRLAWRTRFRLEADVAHDGTISLSDPVIAHAYRGRPLPEGRSSPTLQPHGSLVIPTGATVGVYAEASGLRPGTGGLLRYRVHVEVDRSDEPSLPVRVVQWLGRAVGLVGEEHRAVLAWDAAAAPGSGPVPVAFDLDLAGLDPGLHAVTVQITDPVSGASATSSRLVRIAEP